MRLIDCLGSTEKPLFSDAAVLEAMLAFEVALARAQARLGIIPSSAADSIAKATPAAFDPIVLAHAARENATLAIPFVKALTAHVHSIDPSASGFVHYGATSQDLTDTALILLLRNAAATFSKDHRRLALLLRTLSNEHSSTVMLARTLLQPAPPITFGYKVAGWLGATSRAWHELDGALHQAFQLQFGGASGTLASYGSKASALSKELGRELNLAVPAAPWHAHRDRLAAVVTNCGIFCASLGKIARDISLLMQFEVGEVSERGGTSSAMPHKCNPAESAVALAAAIRVPGLVATYLSGMLQEHERAVGGIQAEWQTVSAVVEATATTLEGVTHAIQGLTVDPARMRANIDATRGAICSEQASMLLAEIHGRLEAQALVARALATGLPLQEALTGLLTPEQIEAIADPNLATGSSELFRRQLLEEEDELNAPD